MDYVIVYPYGIDSKPGPLDQDLSLWSDGHANVMPIPDPELNRTRAGCLA